MLLAIDTETTGLDFFHGCRPFMITACDGTYTYVWQGQVNPYNREVYWEDEELKSFTDLVHKASRIIMHNTTFDMRALASIGVDISSFWDRIEDTLIASHAICSGDTHNLKDLAIKYCDYWDDDEEALATTVKESVRHARQKGYDVAKAGHRHFPGLRKTGTSFWKQDYWLAPEACATYGGRDAERTWLLWDCFRISLMQDGLWDAYCTRKRLLKIAYDMQTTGKHFYVQQAKDLIESNAKEMEELRWAVKKIAGINYRFNPNSRDHLIDLIHTRLEIPIEFYTSGKTPKPAMDKKALDSYFQRYRSPALTKLARYKRLQKQNTDLTGYLAWVDENNRTHSNLNITGTRETRQSSSNPNDQNTDKLLKTMFGPPPGKVWICTDMVNIELRIWAYSVGNKELIEAFETGRSVHQMIMEIIFPQHTDAYVRAKSKLKSQLNDDDQLALKIYGRVKNGNFARIYGATDNKTNETYHGGKNPLNYCAKIDARFPGIREFTRTRIAMAEQNYIKYNVFGVTTLGGYRLDVPPDEPFKACNFYVQGGAGWIMTQAMIDWHDHPDYKRYDCAMNSQVHDGLDTEVAITPALPRIIDAKCLVISQAGRKYIPTCDVTWELNYHPSDETNPIIQDIISSR